MRGCDGYGCGHNGASRGHRIHLGADYESVPGQPVVSPADAHVQRVSNPYRDDQRLTGLLLIAKDGNRAIKGS